MPTPLCPKTILHPQKSPLPEATSISEAQLAIPTDQFRFYDVNSNLLEKHCRVLDSWSNDKERQITSINWFVPSFINPYGGGHYNIFRFMNFFSKKGIKNRLIIYNFSDGTDKSIYDSITKLFPRINLEVILCPQAEKGTGRLDIENIIPYADLTFATTWQSAYYAVKFNNTRGKYYFIQDYEPLFYPAGSQSSLAEATYKWKFPAITFGQWLSSLYRQRYHSDAQDFIPCADNSVFKPISPEPRKKVKRVFFFSRPISERRAFEIGILTLEKLVNKYPDIEVVMAGSIGIDLKNYDIPFNYENLGSLTIEETSKLYQICDIGLCFSATNLSFLPLELMASGCLVITNKGETTEWLLKDGFNCLLSDPVVSLLLEKFDIAIHNYELRKEIITNGLKTTHLTSWEDEFERVHNFILKGEYQNPVYL